MPPRKKKKVASRKPKQVVGDEKKLTLPSGLEVVLRTPGLIGLRRIHEVLPVLDTARLRALLDATDVGMPNEWIDGMYRIAAVVCVDPRFSDADPAPEGTTSLDDLSLEDGRELLNEANEFYWNVVKQEATETDPLAETTS